MAGKRRVFGAAFKAKVALAAAKGDRTTAQLASQFGVHTSQVTAWKKQLMAQVAEMFADGRQRRPDQTTAEQELYEQIGRLKMKVEWLTKKLPRSAEVKRQCIEPNHEPLSVARQCQLVGLARSSRYYEPVGESPENLALMREIERLWRTVKYEEVYLRDYADGWQANNSLERYFDFYRNERPHRALGNRTPLEVYAE